MRLSDLDRTVPGFVCDLERLCGTDDQPGAADVKEVEREDFREGALPASLLAPDKNNVGLEPQLAGRYLLQHPDR